MKIQRALAGAVLLCLASGGAAIAADNPNETRGSESKPCLVAGQDMGTITMSGVTEGWPPNHKPADLLFTIDENDDADPLDGVSISAAGSHTDDGNGAGDPNNTDVAGGAQVTENDGDASTGATFLRERAGTGEGRVYNWAVAATVDNGLACDPVTFQTTVVHDQGVNEE